MKTKFEMQTFDKRKLFKKEMSPFYLDLIAVKRGKSKLFYYLTILFKSIYNIFMNRKQRMALNKYKKEVLLNRKIYSYLTILALILLFLMILGLAGKSDFNSCLMGSQC